MASKERPNGYWTYERVVEVAKKYTSRGEFGVNSKHVYEIARKNGWLKEFDWLSHIDRKPRGYWQNYEHCYEEAKKYNSTIEFENNSGGAYNASLKNGWLKDFTWFVQTVKPNGYWQNYDNCKAEAMKYTSRSEFVRGCGSAYNSALDNGWIDGFTWLVSPTVRKHKDSKFVIYAYEDPENKVVYVGLSKDLNRRHRAHINGSMHRGVRVYDNLHKYFELSGKEIPFPRIKMRDLSAEDAQYYEDWYKQKYADDGWALINKAKTGVGSSSLGLAVEKWDEDSCREISKKFKSRGEFALGAHAAYEKARANGWIDSYDWLQYVNKSPYYWHNYDNCYAEAFKCKTLTEFHKRCSKGYSWAKEQGWIKDYTWFIKKEMPKGWWNNYEHCKEEALKYTNFKDFRTNCGSAYLGAKRNGWLDEFFPKKVA